jgi:hypothetical protein
MAFWAGMKAMGSAAGKWGMANPVGRGAMVGAGLGGIMGGLSDNSTFARGAMAGGALGAMGGYGARLAPGLKSAYKMGSGMGSGLGWSAKYAGFEMARSGYGSASYLGNTAKRAYNGIRGFFK